MKAINIIIFLFILICPGCKKDIKGFYDSLHFVRVGGGEIEFNLFKTEDSEEIKALITKYNYRDTTLQIVITITDENASAFNSLNRAMNNQIRINGDYKESSLPTGTWAYIYMVNDNNETLITNTTLRNSLIQFEGFIREKIE